MNDQELADLIVECGVGYNYHGAADHYGLDIQEPDWNDLMSADQFINDPRVAMAMAEKLHENPNRRIVITTPSTDSKYQVFITWYFGSNDGQRISSYGDSMSRAINEACARAISDDQHTDEEGQEDDHE